GQTHRILVVIETFLELGCGIQPLQYLDGQFKRRDAINAEFRISRVVLFFSAFIASLRLNCPSKCFWWLRTWEYPGPQTLRTSIRRSSQGCQRKSNIVE